MPYKDFDTPDSQVLYGADVKTYMADQCVITCTSSTRPSSPPEGMLVYETDTNRMSQYSGSTWVQAHNLTSWNNYTPTLTSSATTPTLGSGSTASGAYTRMGAFIAGEALIQFGTSGVNNGSGTYRFSLPVTTGAGVANKPCGRAVLVDSSSVAMCDAVCVMNAGGSYMEFRYAATAPIGSATAVTDLLPWTWAASDYLWVNFFYEMQ